MLTTLATAVLLGCGDAPFDGWGFNESPDPDPTAGRADAIAGALTTTEWEWLRLSDHSTERTTFTFHDAGEATISWRYNDVFLDEQPEAREDIPGTWSVDARGDVAVEWQLADDTKRVVRTFVVLQPELANAFLGRSIDSARWVSGGYLAQDRELTQYHNFWVQEWSTSVGSRVAEGNVHVDISFSAPITELTSSNCEMTIDFMRPAVGESPSWSTTIDTPCEVREVDDDIVSVRVAGDETSAWDEARERNGIDREDELWDRLAWYDSQVYFSRARPGTLITTDIWDSFVAVDE